jgi:hypothetical protein
MEMENNKKGTNDKKKELMDSLQTAMFNGMCYGAITSACNEIRLVVDTYSEEDSEMMDVERLEKIQKLVDQIFELAYERIGQTSDNDMKCVEDMLE